MPVDRARSEPPRRPRRRSSVRGYRRAPAQRACSAWHRSGQECVRGVSARGPWRCATGMDVQALALVVQRVVAMTIAGSLQTRVRTDLRDAPLPDLVAGVVTDMREL